MNFVDLTMPLNHRWMPDEGLPTAIKFFLGPKDHQEKGMVVGSDSGTSLALPSLFAEFRKTTRLDQVPVEKLFLRPAVVAHINKGDREEISKSDVEKAFKDARPAKGDAFLIITGWGDKPYQQAEGNEYILGSPHFSFEAARIFAQALHDNEKAKKDFAVEMEFARLGITTVRKLVQCGQIKSQRIKLLVSPLNIVRGVASSCRVVAVEE